MTVPYGWAKRPMLERIDLVKADIPISFIYGSRSSIDSDSGYALKKNRPDVEITVCSLLYLFAFLIWGLKKTCLEQNVYISGLYSFIPTLCHCVCLTGDQRRRPLCFRRPARWLQPNSPSDPRRGRGENWGRGDEAVKVPPSRDELTRTIAQLQLYASLPCCFKKDQSLTEDICSSFHTVARSRCSQSKVRWCHHALYSVLCR